MQYRPLGNTDTKVSVICLGTMTFGEQNTREDAYAQMDMAVGAGVNFFDTAELYAVPMRAETYGRTEEYIGGWLARRGKRDDVIIASKIAGPGMRQPNSPPPLEWIRGGNTRYDRKNITAAVESSLKRLQTDYIDLYQLHWPDRSTNFFGQSTYRHQSNEEITPFAETLAVLGDIIQAGKIRHIGLSNETAWGVSQCLTLADYTGLPRIVSVQNPYNLLNRSYEISLAEISAREQCGLLPYSPLAFGVLSGKYLNNKMPENSRLKLFPMFTRYLTEKSNEAVADYYALAKKRNIDLAQLSIAFTIQQPFITSSIIGATTLEQLQCNLQAAEVVIDDSLREELEALGKKHFNPCP